MINDDVYGRLVPDDIRRSSKSTGPCKAMPELALHILDLVQNSVSAGATRVVVTIFYDTARTPCSSPSRTMARACPRNCSRALKAPLPPRAPRARSVWAFRCSSRWRRCAAGNLTLQSTVGKGTKTQATFIASHMDLPPMGDLKGTLETLIIANPERPDFA